MSLKFQICSNLFFYISVPSEEHKLIEIQSWNLNESVLIDNQYKHVSVEHGSCDIQYYQDHYIEFAFFLIPIFSC